MFPSLQAGHHHAFVDGCAKTRCVSDEVVDNLHLRHESVRILSAIAAPGSWTVQLGMTRQKLSQRPRHVSPTRPRSRMMWSTLAAASSWLSESPACPAPTITVSTAGVIDWRAATSGSIGLAAPAGAAEAAFAYGADF